MLNTRLRAVALTFPTAVIVAAIAGSTSAAATPLPTNAIATADQTTIVRTAPGAAGQGIIMRDGGICDPIRHMGC